MKWAAAAALQVQSRFGGVPDAFLPRPHQLPPAPEREDKKIPSVETFQAEAERVCRSVRHFSDTSEKPAFAIQR